MFSELRTLTAARIDMYRGWRVFVVEGCAVSLALRRGFALVASIHSPRSPPPLIFGNLFPMGEIQGGGKNMTHLRAIGAASARRHAPRVALWKPYAWVGRGACVRAKPPADINKTIISIFILEHKN